MMRAISFAALILMSASCVPASGDAPIRILNAHLPLLGEAECVVSPGDTTIGSASLDIALFVAEGLKPDLLVQFDLESIFDEEVDRVGDDVLAGSERLDFYLDAVTYTYTLAADGSTFAPAQRTVTYGVVRSGDTLSMVLNLIPNITIGNSLTAAVPAGGAPIDLFVGVQIEGHTPGGVRARSTLIQFPIRVGHSAGVAACPGPPAGIGPCGTVGGQFPTQPVCTAP